MTKRIAIVAGLALLLGAALFTLLPTSASGATCGHWFSPEFTKANVSDLLGRQADLDAQIESSGDIPGNAELAAENEASAARLIENYRACDDALDTRRNLSIGLLIAAGVVPAAILFVGGRKDQTATL